MTGADFLLELRCEEIPARMQAGARKDLARLFGEELQKAGLSAGELQVYSTPRRLALVARDLPLETEPRREELKGPRTSAPPQALDGFLRKTGLAPEQLEDRDGVYFAVIETPGQATRDLLGPMIERIVRTFPWPKSMRWGEASNSMSAIRWVRPLHSVVALFGDEIVPVNLAWILAWEKEDKSLRKELVDSGLQSGATTLGHRFHHPGPITLGGAHDYAQKLRACHVIVDHGEREALIRDAAQQAASAAGLALVEDEGLVVENAGLTEWPVPLLGRFDADYLDVPREVIVLTMRSNQKYFACTIPPQDGEGNRPKGGGGGSAPGTPPPPPSELRADGPPPRTGEESLAPAFVCVANIEAADGGVSIVEGNKRVLAARLADARFFWEQDLKVPLEEQAKKLEQIVFHEKLGTVADKVERVAKLARWLVEEGIVKGADADQVERAARLAKADLVSGMVGEFPDVQGTIGGYLARAQGEPDAIADAIRDHYKPVGQGEAVPTAPVTVAVSLADKLDTVVSFFLIDEKPSGSRDPFAVRRAALAVIQIIVTNHLRLLLMDVVNAHIDVVQRDAQKFRIAQDRRRAKQAGVSMGMTAYGTAQALKAQKLRGQRFSSTSWELLEFFADRLKVQQREAGVRHDLIDAVFALGGEDDLVRLLARVNALQAFVETDEGADLLTAYKRAANILKKEEWDETRHPELGSGSISSSPERSPGWMRKRVQHDGLGAEEQSFVSALDEAEPEATRAVAAEDFTGAMAALARLRGPIDSFFEHVTVNDPDADIRERRLNLLMRFRDAVHRVADFSKIEG